MNRPLIMIALVLAVLGFVFLFTNMGGNVALILLAAAVVLVVIGVLTGN